MSDHIADAGSMVEANCFQNGNNSIQRYRKKPVVIEAARLTEDNAVEVSLWCWGYRLDGRLKIPTIEGTMEARVGDYIIKGIQGEFYPCKADIFEQTYDKEGL